ncbi:hypothetical protein [Streptomyces sp. f150]|uniref:hypothetical protein n=1 Tax=Streptomyces sp. f150 TaxID=1827699 RepID=UPI000BF165B4|nr:hypothetical protein [Streptomyces sp. f150]
MTEEEPHACEPGATVYYCPTADDTESDCHGGFDVCCTAPDTHQQLIPCSLAHCRQVHPAHSWEPQPGMSPVRCEGYSGDPAATWSPEPCGRIVPHPAHKFMRGRAARQCPGVELQLDQSAIRRRRALAFNAVGPVLAKHDRHLPLSVRQEIADAVLAAIDGDTRVT